MNKNNIEIENQGGLFNINNKLIDKKVIYQILETAGIKNHIHDLNIWQTAFIHNSYSRKCKLNKIYNRDNKSMKDIDMDNTPPGCIPIKDDSNERIEFLGDTILQTIITTYLFNRYPNQDEGFLTKLRSKIVKTGSLSVLTTYYGMEKYILMSEYVEKSCNGRSNKKILEDTFEAFIGAMYKDFGHKDHSIGFAVCEKFIIDTIEKCLDITSLIITDDNYKDILMRIFHKKFNGKFPTYHEISRDEDTKTFTVGVKHPISGKIIGQSTSSSKKQAEQNAAQFAIKSLEKDGITL